MANIAHYPQARHTSPRILPVPMSLPAFDDELDVAERSASRLFRSSTTSNAQGTLALTITGPSGLTSEPQLPQKLRLGAEPSQSAPPDPRRWAATLTQAVLETLQGRRPLQQLTRWTTEVIYRKLAVLTETHQHQPRPIRSPFIRSIRTCHVNDETVEASVVVHNGARANAIALRLEADKQRWLCTVLEII